LEPTKIMVINNVISKTPNIVATRVAMYFFILNTHFTKKSHIILLEYLIFSLCSIFRHSFS